MATRILSRNGTAAEWDSANPVLGQGEIGYDSTNNRIKVGDGSTNWNDLDFLEPKVEATSGAYDPVVSNTSNVSSVDSIFRHRWTRLGDVVHVAGMVRINPNNTGQTSLEVTIPVPRIDGNFEGSSTNGSGNASTFNGSSGIVQTVNGTERLAIVYNAVSSGAANLSWSATYRLTNAST